MELKFRVYDLYNKEMHTQGSTLLGNVVGAIVGCTEPLDDKEKEQYKIMQYTGLKDKNGTEIYFGDILGTYNDNSEYDIWDYSEHGYTVVQENSHELGVIYSDWAMTCFRGDESVFAQEFVKVIGNIYENPELLENK